MSDSLNYMVAVDESHASELAFERALELARPSDPIFVVTVQREVASNVAALGFFDGVPATSAAWATQAEEAQHTSSKNLLQHYGHLAKARGRDVTLLLAHGAPEEAIVEEAKDRQIDTLVLGRRPLGSVQRFFVGSSSAYVVEHADANVVVVHDEN